MVLSNSVSSSDGVRRPVSRWPDQLSMLLNASEYSDDIYRYLRELEVYIENFLT